MITFHALSSPGKSEPEAWDDFYSAAIRSGSGRAHACEIADSGIEARRERYPVVVAEPAETEPAPPPSGPSIRLCAYCDFEAMAGAKLCPTCANDDRDLDPGAL